MGHPGLMAPPLRQALQKTKGGHRTRLDPSSFPKAVRFGCLMSTMAVIFRPHSEGVV